MTKPYGTKEMILIAALSAVLGAFLARSLDVPLAFAKAGATPPVVSAREFQLTDDQGRLRARLYLANPGTPGATPVNDPTLEFLDQQNRVRLILGLERATELPYVKMTNNAAEDTLYMGFNEAEMDSPGIFIYKKYKIDQHLNYSNRKRVLLPIEVIWPKP